MQQCKVWVIRNPMAGWYSRRSVKKMLDLLSEKMQVVVRDTCYSGHARQLALTACQENVNLLIGAGGDGTINEIINGLITHKQEHYTCPMLAIFPSGTVNLVASELEISRDPQAFVDIICANKHQDIWPAKVNGQYFIANVGVGFDAYIVSKVTQRFKRHFSTLSYTYQSLRLLSKHWRQKYEITVDGVNYSVCAAIVVNSRYYAGRYSVAPSARLTVPTLYICLFEDGGRWELFTYMWWLVRGKLYKHKHTKIITGNEIHIDGTAPYVQIDGDPASSFPLHIYPGDTKLEMLVK